MTENSPTLPTDQDERKIAETILKAADDKLQSMCVSHAATFVAVERRGSELSASLKKLITTLDSSVEGVSKSKLCLEIAADEGKDSTLTTLAEKHRLRRRTLLQHSTLLELLELPSLMDACVRGHLYEEALSIASFANTLERRHLISSPPLLAEGYSSSKGDQCNPVVANVVNEVRKRELDLRRHLLHRLRSNVTMPQCLEVVTALRRLNGISLEKSSLGTSKKKIDLEKVHEVMERRLQVDFLEARDVWLDGATAAVGRSGSIQNDRINHLASSGKLEQFLDNIDVYRTRCFEITTQYLAIFYTPSSQQQTANVSGSLPKSLTASHALQLLSMWATRRIHFFLTNHLSKINLSIISDIATLRDAWDSSTFFATSMGRVGADFSPLLAGIFEPCIVSIVTSHWIDGVHALNQTLKVCRDAGIASPLHSTSGTSTSSEHDLTDNGNNEQEESISKQSKTPSPPRQLLSLPPLARLVNAFLVGLNELRRCLLPNTFPQLRVFFQEEFVIKVKEIFVVNERAVLTPGFLNQKGEQAGKLRTLALDLKESFESCVEPYLNVALEVALGVFQNEKVDMIEENEAACEETLLNEQKEETCEGVQSDKKNVLEEKRDVDATNPLSQQSDEEAVKGEKMDGVDPTLEQSNEKGAFIGEKTNGTDPTNEQSNGEGGVVDSGLKDEIKNM